MYRKATLGDCKGIYDLICELESKKLPYDKFTEIFEKQTEDQDYYCIVCLDDNENIVGALNLRFEEQLHHAGLIAEIMELVVAPECRKKGIGKQMLALACNIAKDQTCLQIEAASGERRVDAHRFYQREGLLNSHFKFTKIL
ncbi:MAG: GNAT family N-acetyltransferase [Clostridia bacterium]|nr:GNAT family N-acetyltransferase [Clostridia bacterium]